MTGHHDDHDEHDDDQGDLDAWADDEFWDDLDERGRWADLDLDWRSVAVVAAAMAAGVLVILLAATTADTGKAAGGLEMSDRPALSTTTTEPEPAELEETTTTTEAPATSEPFGADELAPGPIVPPLPMLVAVALTEIDVDGVTWPKGRRFTALASDDATVTIVKPALTPATAVVPTELVRLDPGPWLVVVDRPNGLVTVTHKGHLRWSEPVEIGPACAGQPPGLYSTEYGTGEPAARVARVAGWAGLGFHGPDLPHGCFEVANHVAGAWAHLVPAGTPMVLA